MALQIDIQDLVPAITLNPGASCSVYSVWASEANGRGLDVSWRLDLTQLPPPSTQHGRPHNRILATAL